MLDSWLNKVSLGDCLDIMKQMPDNCIDAVVTDPPYGLTDYSSKNNGNRTGFMNQAWDGNVPSTNIWSEVLRIAKPGAHLLAFGGTRTHHRLACAIEDAGWEVRDCIMYLYGSGFPKSLNVSKAIDKRLGAKREVVGQVVQPDKRGGNYHGASEKRPCILHDISVPTTNAAKQWTGYGTALKPAYEPILLCRKPLEGTVAENVMKYGTGALNIDGCRIGTRTENESGWSVSGSKESSNRSITGKKYARQPKIEVGIGRFPANVIHDGSEEVLALFPQRDGMSGGGAVDNRKTGKEVIPSFNRKPSAPFIRSDSGSAARFFYTAKASPSERGSGNTHPTVKPLDLMKYLMTLVSCPSSIILDPFIGSGTTALAAIALGRRWIGIELQQEYVDICESRIREAMVQPNMFAQAATNPSVAL